MAPLVDPAQATSSATVKEPGSVFDLMDNYADVGVTLIDRR